MDEGEQGGEPDRQQTERQGPLRRQGGGRDQDGGEEQERERILQAAGEEQQARELHDVEGEKQRRRIVAQPVARGKADSQRKIQPARGGNDEEAPAEGQVEPEPELRTDDGRTLPGEREPAQANEGVEPQVAARRGQGLVSRFHHGAATIGLAGGTSTDA